MANSFAFHSIMIYLIGFSQKVMTPVMAVQLIANVTHVYQALYITKPSRRVSIKNGILYPKLKSSVSSKSARFNSQNKYWGISGRCQCKTEVQTGIIRTGTAQAETRGASSGISSKLPTVS